MERSNKNRSFVSFNKQHYSCNLNIKRLLSLLINLHVSTNILSRPILTKFPQNAKLTGDYPEKMDFLKIPSNVRRGFNDGVKMVYVLSGSDCLNRKLLFMASLGPVKINTTFKLTCSYSKNE